MGFYRFIEYYFFFFQVFCESIFQDRFILFFIVYIYVDGVVFYIIVVVVLMGQVSEIFDCFYFVGIQVYLMWVFSYCYREYGVLDGIWIIVCQVFGFVIV